MKVNIGDPSNIAQIGNKSHNLDYKTEPKFLDKLDQFLPKSGDLQQIQAVIAKADKVNPAELLGYQIKASNYHLRVELVSKVAESALGTVKKLQGS